jgi:hypothetical protein
MTKYTCPTCGRSDAVDAARTSSDLGSNHRRDISLTIPEEHLFIFKLIFRQMNIKFGMMGLGEFANILPDYSRQIPIDSDVFRGFDDVKLAQIFLGIQRGYRISTRIDPKTPADTDSAEPVQVTAILTPSNGDSPIEAVISDRVDKTRATKVCAYLEDAAARLSFLETQPKQPEGETG